jgi:hypothetical protein
VNITAAEASLLGALIAGVVAMAVSALTFRFTRTVELDSRRFERRAEVYVELLVWLGAWRMAVGRRRPDGGQGEPSIPDLAERETSLLLAKSTAFASRQVSDHVILCLVAALTASAVNVQLAELGSDASAEAEATRIRLASRRDHEVTEMAGEIAQLQERIRQELQPQTLYRTRHAWRIVRGRLASLKSTRLGGRLSRG